MSRTGPGQLRVVFAMGARLADIGAARLLLPDQVGEASVRESLRAVLHDPAYRQRAAVVAREISAMPGPPDVVESLRRRSPAR